MRIFEDDHRRYGVIAEFKTERPLIMESYLLNYEDARKRMMALAGDPKVVRVAVFVAEIVQGNASLMPTPEQTVVIGG